MGLDVEHLFVTFRTIILEASFYLVPVFENVFFPELDAVLSISTTGIYILRIVQVQSAMVVPVWYYVADAILLQLNQALKVL